MYQLLLKELSRRASVMRGTLEILLQPIVFLAEAEPTIQDGEESAKGTAKSAIWGPSILSPPEKSHVKDVQKVSIRMSLERTDAKLVL